MCSKAEVREVMLETRAPAWMKYVLSLLSGGAVILLAWLSITVHSQAGYLKDFRTDMVMSMGDIRIASSLENAELSEDLSVLSTELKNTEEKTISRNTDRNKLIDERCATFSRRLDAVEDAIKNIRNNQLTM